MKKILGLVLALVGLAGCRSKTAPPASLVLPAPDSQGVYHLTAEALFGLYETDGKEADRLLRGKPAVVTGWVEREHSAVEIDKEAAKRGERPRPDLFLHVPHTSNGFYIPVGGVICTFPESARDTLRATLKKLDRYATVQVRGIVDGKLGSVFLKDCTLERGA
ncbi:hypothetical protein [Armatimonas rosea]|uniref:Uncharacterized protein n=1 Tax=Armatimonas rosea TaxID=685828 RepID=A0A7W9SXD2_ARMRO|nr:hypothetical protein [Armatimonas rosea]MBB6053624.1 hypothetical protein [Armatimonas rosea]